jgi:DNA-damage-inducible protein D
MVDIGSKTTRKIIDYKLSRYACYLIVMNGNPQKEIRNKQLHDYKNY